MKDAFRHYFRPTDAEIALLWQNALFSFDASVLLNVYGYSRDTREELISFLENNSDRLRLPYQFGLEFARNRCSTIMKQVQNYRAAETELKRIKANFLGPRHQHPYLSEEHLANYDDILQDFEKSREEIRGLIKSDRFLDRLLVAFNGKLGPAPTEAELTQLHAEAKERYDANIPPGYADLKRKGGPAAYGDYVGWRQLIAISKLESRTLILIIDDVKDDWWHKEHGETMGPRPELLDEFSRESGQQLYMYTSDNFLRFAKSSGVAEISDQVIAEVGQRLASQREDRAAEMMKLKSTDFDSSVPPDTSEMKISGDEEIESFPESPKITPTDRS